MKHITLTCPECSVLERAVGDPDERDFGHSGVFHCFECGANGKYEVTFTLKAEDQP